MSNAELFVVGTIITLVVVLAITPLIWAAIQDGRADDAIARERDERLPAEPRPGLGA